MSIQLSADLSFTSPTRQGIPGTQAAPQPLFSVLSQALGAEAAELIEQVLTEAATQTSGEAPPGFPLPVTPLPLVDPRLNLSAAPPQAQQGLPPQGNLLPLAQVLQATRPGAETTQTTPLPVLQDTDTDLPGIPAQDLFNSAVRAAALPELGSPALPPQVRELIDTALSGAAAAPEAFKALKALADTGEYLGTQLVKPPVGGAGWDQALGGRVLLLAQAKSPMAELRLNPPHLGPLEVRINMEGDQASVSFSTHHAQVREALEMALPRLREMLAEQGIALAQADVSQQQLARDGQGPGRQRGAAGEPGGAGEDALSEIQAPRVVEVRLGLVDYYA